MSKREIREKVIRQIKCPFCGRRFEVDFYIIPIVSKPINKGNALSKQKIEEEREPVIREIEFKGSDYRFYVFQCENCEKILKSKDFYYEETEEEKERIKNELLKEINQCIECGKFVCPQCFDENIGLCINCKQLIS